MELATYNEEPDAFLFTAEEIRECRSCLIKLKRYSANVNQLLAALRGLLRYYARSVNIKGMKCHHCRDVTLQEDGTRISKPQFAHAISIINNFVIGLVNKLG